jgi:hypothetical protein
MEQYRNPLVAKREYIINQTPPNNIGFRTMYSPYACHDIGSIYESLSFQNHHQILLDGH